MNFKIEMIQLKLKHLITWVGVTIKAFQKPVKTFLRKTELEPIEPVLAD